MERCKRRVLAMATDASGAYEAALSGLVVMIVDVIDMSTTVEAVLQAGASVALGASPSFLRAPVPVDPEAVGKYAARKAKELKTEVVVIAEPRVASEAERFERAAAVLRGMRSEGIEPVAVCPNLGAETVKLVDFGGKVVVAVTDCGGTAFDAAFNAGASVLTGTVARTVGKTGWENAESAVARALEVAEKEGRGLCIVAASSKSPEDVLAAQYLVQLALAKGFMRLI
ncbi:MAG: hypothetical protein ACPLTR_01210 [Thermacetogeniaceae bacterium]